MLLRDFFFAKSVTKFVNFQQKTALKIIQTPQEKACNWYFFSWAIVYSLQFLWQALCDRCFPVNLLKTAYFHNISSLLTMRNKFFMLLLSLEKYNQPSNANYKKKTVHAAFITLKNTTNTVMLTMRKKLFMFLLSLWRIQPT